MKKTLLLIFCFSFFLQINAQTLVHYWNFNNSATEVELLSPSFSAVPSSSLEHTVGSNGAGANSAIPLTGNTTGQGFETNNINARNTDVAGAHLRFNNPIGGKLIFSLPTSGFNSIVIKYATRRSGQGAHNQLIDYSLNGTDYIALTTIQPANGDPTLQTFDFSSIAGVANNPLFKIRIGFTQGAGGLEGNNRFDNFTLEGLPLATEQVIHYWNFNDASTFNNLITPNVALVPGSKIDTISNGTSAIIDLNGTGQNFDVQNLNARNGDVAGTHLRFNNPIGGNLVYSLPTTGVSDVMVKYVSRRSGSGAGTQILEFTTDGLNWKPVINYTITETPTLFSVNFSDSIGVSNNAQFKLRFGFAQGSAGTVGNNRFDNFSVDGKTSAVDNNAPTCIFSPVNNATAVPVSNQPTISFNKEIRFINNSAVTNDNVASLIDLRLTNESGSLVAFSATIANNKVITITPNTAFLPSTQYYLALKPNMVEGTNNIAFVGSASTTFTTVATSFVAFTHNFVSVSEADGSAQINLTLTNPVSGSFRLSLMPAPWSNANPTSDYYYTSTTINTTPSSPTALQLVIPVVDDAESELDEYFVLAIENLNGMSLQGRQYLTIYIRDNDRKAPTPTKEIALKYIGSFDPEPAQGSTTEIVAYDSITRRLFMTSAVQDRLDIADFSNPAAITIIRSVDMSAYGGITSVAVRNGILAVACPNIDDMLNGSIAFFNTNGDFQTQVTVGVLPDMICFSPDGSKVLTANEGQPNAAYTIDPEGSVSIVDVSGGMASINQSKVTTVLFTDFNAQQATLLAAGIRKTKNSSTLSQDLEPEYIAFSIDGKKAFVTCQENNAIAEFDLETLSFTRIWGLGTKDFNTVAGGGIDACDNNGFVHISNWPVKSFFMPDAIATYNVGGETFIVSANEGDEKEYAGLNERTTVGNAAVVLDPTKFPNAAMLKESFNIGRFRISNLNGDTDSDGDYDNLINIGARSFSIWNATTGSLVFDSKDEIELFISTHPTYGALFNADHEANSRKGRSHSKGPEPEGVTLAQINGQTYAFIVLERVGGTLVYNITDPANVKLVDYRNERTLNAIGGDRGAESVIYISPTASPNGKPHVIVSNEISGTLTIYEIDTESSLPVSLLQFNAHVNADGTAKLNWSTASEQNNAFFTLEHSSNGRNYTELTKVASLGNSQNQQNYSAIHPNPTKGINYYRLSQTDLDGKLTYAPIKTIHMSAKNNSVGVYPNPVLAGSQLVILNNAQSNGQVLVTITDMAGRQITSRQLSFQNGHAQLRIPLNLQAGTYLLKADGQKLSTIVISQ